MSKAEERAKERYWLEPNNIETQEKYAAYVEGYHQAEKDLELTWEDILSILKIHVEVYEDETLGHQNKQKVCQEVLKRFKEQRT